MERANAILGLRAETPVHAGTGASTGVVDLPIQREGHNNWPCVFGSALKGALRATAEERLGKPDPSIPLVFGPETNNASEHAGALMVGDARLALLPVRSLTSHFRWVTCPAALERLERDAERLGIELGSLQVPMLEDPDTALVPSGGGDLFLEELRFKAQKAELDSLIAALDRLMGGAQDSLKNQLTVVNNDRFAHLVQHATPVAAHVRIESETKTVATGGLWYEETLPPETVLYAPLSAAPARKPAEGQEEGKSPEPALQASGVLQAVTARLFTEHPFVQVGGNETVGMGWCRTAVVKEG